MAFRRYLFCLFNPNGTRFLVLFMENRIRCITYGDFYHEELMKGSYCENCSEDEENPFEDSEDSWCIR
jgi:hypothetical protein